jgi:hypothetical protein
MKRIGMKLLFVGVILVVLLGGCSKKEPAVPAASKTSGGAGGIDLSAAIDDLKAAAAKMDLPQLQAKAKEYLSQITSKQEELKTLMDKFAAIPLAQKMGDEAKTLQTKIADTTGSISELTQRFKVFVDAIKEKDRKSVV